MAARGRRVVVAGLDRRDLAFGAGLLLFFAFYAAILVRFDLRREAWIYGDWVINYAGGFIRRGITGEVLLALVPVAWLQHATLGLHLLLYAAFFALLFAAFRSAKADLLVLICLFSPLGLFYGVFNVYAIGKKEVLLFLLMLVQICFLSRPGVSALLHAGFVALSGSVLLLAHEGMYFFLVFPLWIVLQQVAARSGLAAAAAVTLCVLAALTAVEAAVALLSRAEAVEPICDALGAGAPADCHASAVGYLQASPIGALADTFAHLSRASLLSLALTLALGFVPLALLFARLRQSLAPPLFRFMAATLALCVAFTLPLYVVGQDWGRWLHITYLALLFASLAFLRMHGSERHFRDDMGRLGLPAFGVLALLAVYDLGWNPPMLNREIIKAGIFTLGARLAGQ